MARTTIPGSQITDDTIESIDISDGTINDIDIGNVALATLSDVTESSPANGQVFARVGGEYTLRNPVHVGTAAPTEFVPGTFWYDTDDSSGTVSTFDAAAVTTGEFADARISETSIRQHMDQLLKEKFLL